MSVVLLLTGVLGGCRVGTIGQACHTRDFARDEAHVLACRHGRWSSTGLTLAQALQIMALTTSTTTTTTTSATSPIIRFDYTGGHQFWTVPEGTHVIDVWASGGMGGSGGPDRGGYSGVVTTYIPVTPGEVFDVNVAGDGNQDGTGGYGGGGRGFRAGGGGGATTIQLVGGDVLIVAAGGGGGGGSNPACPPDPQRLVLQNGFGGQGGDGGLYTDVSSPNGEDGSRGSPCIARGEWTLLGSLGGQGATQLNGGAGGGISGGLAITTTSPCGLTGAASVGASADASGEGADSSDIGGGGGGGGAGYRGGGAGGNGIQVTDQTGGCSSVAFGTGGGGGGGSNYVNPTIAGSSRYDRGWHKAGETPFVTFTIKG